jgi:hypothetical protein
LRKKGGYGISCAIEIGDADLRITGGAAAANRWLRMAQKTTVAVECRPKAGERFSTESASDRHSIAKQDKSIDPEGDLIRREPRNRMSGARIWLGSWSWTGIDCRWGALGVHAVHAQGKQHRRCKDRKAQNSQDNVSLRARDSPSFHRFLSFWKFLLGGLLQKVSASPLGQLFFKDVHNQS